MQWCVVNVLLISSSGKEKALVYSVCPFLWRAHFLRGCFRGASVALWTQLWGAQGWLT